MAKIVLGIGTSHTPMLALDSTQWIHRAAADYANAALNPTDGRRLGYQALLAESGGKYASEVTPEVLEQKARRCQAALDHLAGALAAARPDVVVIVGDDQGELFGPGNQPMIALSCGKEVTMTSGKYSAADAPDWVQRVGQGYLMDKIHSVPGEADFARELMQGLIERSFDIASVSRIDHPETAGFGHAFGFVIKRLFAGRSIPVVPLMLNTYFPPNVPSPARCHDLGRALRECIEASARDLRVAVIGSGGLTHFVVDDAFDRALIAAFAAGDAQALRSLPRHALVSGSSEILNWIVTAGASAPLPLSWSEYQPLYRTPAGTGCGAGFCIWSDSAA